MSRNTFRVLWRVHGLCGLYSGLFIAVLSLTGAVVVFLPEVDAVMNPALFTASDGASRTGLNEMAARAFERFHEEHERYDQHQMYLPNEHRETVYLRFIVSDANKKGVERALTTGFLEYFFDPVSGRYLGQRDYVHSAAYFLRTLHVRFFDGLFGRQLVGLFGIALAVSTLTGVVIYGNFMRGKLSGIVRLRSWRIFFGDLHKLVGLGAWVFHLMMEITGAWLGLQAWLMAGLNIEKPQAFEAEHIISPEADHEYPLDYEALVAAAAGAIPGFVPGRLHASHDGSRTVSIYGDKPGVIYERYTHRVVLDKKTHEVKYAFAPSKGTAGEKLYLLQEPLHFGDFGGLPLKILYAVLGTAGGVLAISGGFIAVQRGDGTKTAVFWLVVLSIVTVMAVTGLAIGAAQVGSLRVMPYWIPYVWYPGLALAILYPAVRHGGGWVRRRFRKGRAHGV